MLPPQHRLTKEKDFQHLFRRGRPYFSHHLTLKIGVNKEKVSRFGIIVSTRISKKSVVRNRLKRRLRHIMGQRLAKIRPGYDIVVIPKASCIALSAPFLAENIDFLLEKAKLQDSYAR